MRDLAGTGIGLRREHHDVVLAKRPNVSFFEVISENFMVAGGRPRAVLEAVRRDYPVALHGVSLDLGGTDPLSADYLRRLKDLVRWVEPALVSDHLCWSGVAGRTSHDLLPLPFTEDAVHHTAERIRIAQETLGRRILVENVSSYVEFEDSTLGEADFMAAVVEEADCDVLLDVNNLYVNARNHGIDPIDFLDLLPPHRVRQIHLAGHEDGGDLVVDTHDAPVCEAVWDLYREAVERFGPVPTLIERDANVPPLETLLEEACRARRIQRTHGEELRGGVRRRGAALDDGRGEHGCV